MIDAARSFSMDAFFFLLKKKRVLFQNAEWEGRYSLSEETWKSHSTSWKITAECYLTITNRFDATDTEIASRVYYDSSVFYLNALSTNSISK